jgi:hypothetical protein
VRAGDEWLLELSERLYRSATRCIYPREWIPKKINWTEKERARWIRVARLAYTTKTGDKCQG